MKELHEDLSWEKTIKLLDDPDNSPRNTIILLIDDLQSKA